MSSRNDDQAVRTLGGNIFSLSSCNFNHASCKRWCSSNEEACGRQSGYHFSTHCRNLLSGLVLDSAGLSFLKLLVLFVSVGTLEAAHGPPSRHHILPAARCICCKEISSKLVVLKLLADTCHSLSPLILGCLPAIDQIPISHGLAFGYSFGKTTEVVIESKPFPTMLLKECSRDRVIVVVAHRCLQSNPAGKRAVSGARAR